MARLDDVFISLILHPSHGDRKCIVTWEVIPAWDNARFFVYRSDTGANPWKLLTPDGIQGVHEFEDDEFYVDGRLESRYYAIMAEKGTDDWAKTEAVGLFDALERREYNIMRSGIRREIRDRRRGNGLKIWHLMPLTSGEPNPNYDPDTGQKLSSCPDDGSYGLPFKGGYGEPIQTWMKVLSDDAYSEEDKPDGTKKETSTLTVRLLAWPMPRRGNLIIHPPTGDYYVVDSIVKPFRFRGFAPLAYHTKLVKLRRSDPRHSVTVPKFEPDEVTIA